MRLQPDVDEAIALIEPGVGTDRIAHAFPRAGDIGFESEMAASGVNSCHETPPTDGTSAARIEEEVIVTPKGAQIITLFPADELPIANRY
jgi:Xaa-Pro dipeptidase